MLDGNWDIKKFIKKNLTVQLFSIVCVIVLALLLILNISLNPEITFESSSLMIRELSNISITISSIVVATFVAVIAFMVTRQPKLEKIDRIADVIPLPISGIIFGLFSFILSYFDYSFNFVKLCLSISLLMTVGSITALYIIFDWKKEWLLESMRNSD